MNMAQCLWEHKDIWPTLHTNLVGGKPRYCSAKRKGQTKREALVAKTVLLYLQNIAEGILYRYIADYEAGKTT